MFKKQITKVISVILVLLICISASVMSVSAESNDAVQTTSSTRASENHPLLSTVNLTVERTAPFKLQIYIETNAIETVDEIGYTEMKLMQYDEENDTWIQYGAWVSLHNENSQNYNKTSYKYVVRGKHYKVVATHYAKKNGTIIDTVDTYENETAMIYVPTAEEDDVIWDTQM